MSMTSCTTKFNQTPLLKNQYSVILPSGIIITYTFTELDSQHVSERETTSIASIEILTITYSNRSSFSWTAIYASAFTFT